MAATETTRRLPTLPTEDELDEAERLLTKAHEAMESIAWNTQGFSRLFEEDREIPDVLPTSADVGRFYLFAHYLAGRGFDFKTMSDEIIGALPLLGEMATNIELTRSKEASDDA